MPGEYYSGRLTVAAWEVHGRGGEAGYHCKLPDGEVFWIRRESFLLYFKPIPDPFVKPITPITEDDL